MKIIEKLLINADLNYKKFNESIVKGNSPIMGVRIPKLRIIAKDIIKNKEVDIFFKEYEGVYFEEKLIKGLLLASDEDLFNKHIHDYLKTLDSWCLVDTFCNSCKFIKNNNDKYWEFIKSLINSNDEFIIRCGYVLIINYYINEDYINEIIELISKNFDYYYVNMAIAWCISEAYILYSSEIESLLKKKTLCEFVQNKAIDKINDSYRINVEDKVRLRSLKYF